MSDDGELALKQNWSLIQLCANSTYLKDVWIVFDTGRPIMSVEISRICDLALKKKPPLVLYFSCKFAHVEARRWVENEYTIAERGGG